MTMATATPTKGIEAISNAFSAAKKRGQATLIPYICGGFSNPVKCVGILLAMQKGGADIIELGVPCSDPFADGNTIKGSHKVAIDNGTTSMSDVLHILENARSKGLIVPVVLMGYYTSMVGEYDSDISKMCQDAARSGANAFLMVGMGEGKQELEFNSICYKYNLSSIQLVMPGSTDERIADLASMASTFLYIVSVSGKTGARDALPPGLNDTVARVREKTNLPLVVGFGISNPDMVNGVSNLSDGAVVGSFLTDCMNKNVGNELSDEVVMYQEVSKLHSGSSQDSDATNQALVFSQVPLHVAKENIGKSMVARYRWRKAINQFRKDLSVVWVVWSNIFE